MARHKVSKLGKPYTEFRKDGWPLCPRCGEDELYSLAWLNIPRSKLEDYLEAMEGCYSCHWKPE
jgi:hypothetical protein